MSAPSRRDLVRYMIDMGLSERRSLQVVGMSPSAFRYQPAADRRDRQSQTGRSALCRSRSASEKAQAEEDPGCRSPSPRTSLGSQPGVVDGFRIRPDGRRACHQEPDRCR